MESDAADKTESPFCPYRALRMELVLSASLFLNDNEVGRDDDLTAITAASPLPPDDITGAGWGHLRAPASILDLEPEAI